jgi:Mg-chelatase subunit ChlD
MLPPLSIKADTRLHEQQEDPSRIAAIVVLSDGKDTASKLTLDQLLAQIRYDFDQHTVRVFTIGYEAEERTDVLKEISEVTQGRYYEGTQTNIREILRIFRRSFRSSRSSRSSRKADADRNRSFKEKRNNGLIVMRVSPEHWP